MLGAPNGGTLCAVMLKEVLTCIYFHFLRTYYVRALWSGRASLGSVYMTLRTEGLWGLVQKSDTPGFLTGARIGR